MRPLPGGKLRLNTLGGRPLSNPLDHVAVEFLPGKFCRHLVGWPVVNLGTSGCGFVGSIIPQGVLQIIVRHRLGMGSVAWSSELGPEFPCHP
jgi:hypothetical protein